jgi:histidine triad (HIT) family protein
MSEECPFCAIGAGNADPDLVVLRTERVFVTVTLKQRPNNPGQVVVCPIAHATALHTTEAALLRDVFEVVARVAGAAPAALQAVGTTILNNNDAPDQVISHLHVHVIPRFTGDGLLIPNPSNIPAPRSLRLDLAHRWRRALQ